MQQPDGLQFQNLVGLEKPEFSFNPGQQPFSMHPPGLTMPGLQMPGLLQTNAGQLSDLPDTPFMFFPLSDEDEVAPQKMSAEPVHVSPKAKTRDVEVQKKRRSNGWFCC
eukprot:GEMP01025679.1.p1 GENE.GEMP01025679.1~~GEMP01025679.1.p1  ORF type:complete len:109 (+),score=21.86 GEMP01025679.1:300-626(+)